MLSNVMLSNVMLSNVMLSLVEALSKHCRSSLAMR